MKKRKENQFIDKFHLLNSQETSEEISWSLSDSSEGEDHDNKQSNALKNVTNIRRKRKRLNNNKKEAKNLSNLDITITDTVPASRNIVQCEKSPILPGKSKSDLIQHSPILTPSQPFLPHSANRRTCNNTPVTSGNNCDLSKQGKHHKSPVILLKRESPKLSPKVRKKLFESDKCIGNRREDSTITRKTSPILTNKSNSLDKRKCTVSYKDNEANLNNNKDNSIKSITEEINKILNKEQYKPNLKKEMREIFKNGKKEIFIESTSSSLEDSTANAKISRPHLVAKVKSYFDSYFNSQGSQHSISECETPTPNSSSNTDEIEITSTITQVRSVTPSLKEIKTITSLESHIDMTKSKKVKFKKGGLAYRLNGLLKKQNSSLSLWQHERFLAANSNFVIPKEEFLAFRIKNVDFSYSIYLIRVIDVNNDKFLIVINSIYASSNSFEIDDILKIYEPYNVIDSNTCKIVTNVCKFVSEKMKF